MKFDLDDLHTKPLEALLDMALQTEDRDVFWLLSGAITAKAWEVESNHALLALLWDAGHEQPSNFEMAQSVIRELRHREAKSTGSNPVTPLGRKSKSSSKEGKD